MDCNIEVKAYKTTQKQHDAGIFASFEISVKSGSSTLIKLCDGALRKSAKDGSWWMAAPSRAVEVQGQTKYYKYWWLNPDSQDDRVEFERWVVAEILKQINPEEVAERGGGVVNNAGSNPSTTANKTSAPRSPFAGAAASTGSTGASARPNSPFAAGNNGGGGLIPGGRDFALGGGAT